jgi:DNA-binding response OmpR family regulator
MLSYQQPPATRFTLHLNIDLPHTPAALNALADLLTTVAGVPGAVLTTHDDAPWTAAPLPSPRSAEPDDRLHIDPQSRRVLRQGAAIGLTRLEFDLLLYMSTRPNRVHRRNTLMAQVWGITEPRGSRTVDVHIRRLRDKLGTHGRLITTIRGVGYRFDNAHRVVIESA